MEEKLYTKEEVSDFIREAMLEGFKYSGEGYNWEYRNNEPESPIDEDDIKDYINKLLQTNPKD